MAEEFVISSRHSSNGRPFQIVGPTTEKTRYCMVDVGPLWVQRVKQVAVTSERRDWRSVHAEAGQQSSCSRKHAGAVPRRQLYLTSTNVIIKYKYVYS